jgi:hypothetical protein
MAWLYKQDGSDNWWIGYRVNGKQVRRSTKTSDRKAAERQLAKLESVAQAHAAGALTQEFIRHLTGIEAASDTLHALRGQWLNECRDLSPRTVERYKGVLHDYYSFVNATETAPLIRDIQPDTIAAFLRAKRDKNSVETVRQTRRILVIFYNYCVDNRAVQFSPVPSSKSLKLVRAATKRARRAFTITWVA